MKRLFYLIITIALTGNLFGQISPNLQRVCGSQLDFEEMQRSDPDRYQRFMDYERLLQTQLLNSRAIPAGKITIPVVVHIVYFNSAQNISDAQINAQLQVLNNDFQRLNADRVNTPAAFAGVAGDMEFEFKLAKIDPNGNPTTGITRTSTTVNGFSLSSNNVKFTSSGGRNAWNTQQYLNIWVCNLNSVNGNILMGYSTFPSDLATSPNLDGVVINFNYFGVGGHTLSPGTMGRTTTHEVGHWLDLRHIWGDNVSCLIDDGVADTPVQREATYGCPSFPRTDICTTTSPGIMFMNYMDYTDDGCMNLFTSGQKARSRAIFDDLTGLRRQMLTLAGVITNPPTITGSTLACSGYPVTFMVANAPAGFTWDKSSNLINTGSSATSYTVYGTTGYGGGGSPGWVSIKTGNMEIARHDVWVGPPTISYISGATSVQSGRTYPYNALTGNLSAAGSYYWSVSPAGSATINAYGSEAYITFYGYYGNFEVSCYAVNACGTGPVYSFDVSLGRSGASAFLVYPNPVSGILTIEIDEDAAVASRSNSGITYDIRLYNGQGTLLHSITTKGAKVEFNVSGLPNGFYYLHIYNGVDTNPEMRQIRIQH